MKKRIYVLLGLLIALLALSGCSGGGSGYLSSDDVADKKPSGEASEWAIYWYCCGSDLESEGGAATVDIEEMLASTGSNDVTVVIQTGGAASWDNDVVDPSKIERYEYRDGTLSRVDSQPAASMGETGTLTSFLKFCETNYPATHKMLNFWNHGGGSVYGVCFDENYDNDSLTLAELTQGLDSVYGNASQKLDLVGFDACLMATVDTANALKNSAKYMVASEELEPGNGWSYADWLSSLMADPSMDGAALGKVICDAYVTGCEEYETADDITLSVTDLSKVQPLVAAVDAMGNAILSKAASNTNVCGEFARSATKSENYGGNNDEDGYTNMVDLGDLMKNNGDLLGASDDAVQSALSDAVVYKVNGPYRSKSTGLATYYSYNGDTEDLSSYAQISANPTYTKFVQYSLGEDVTADVAATTGNAEVQQVQGFNQSLNMTLDNDGYLNLNLDPASLDSVMSVTFSLSYMDEANNEMVFIGTDNDIDANWDTGVFKDNFRGVWGSMNGQLCYMELSYEGDDYNNYAVPILYNGEERNLNVAYDFNEETFKILGVSSGIDESTGMSSRDSKKLEDGDEIIFLMDAMSLEEGKDDIYTYKSDAITYKKGMKFEEMDLADGDYAYYFTVTDTTGKSVDSDFAYFTVNQGDITTTLK